MSKSFGKSSRRAPAPDKSSDDKRPSVFERLGVRSRENPNSSSYNQSADSYGGSQRRQDTGKSTRHHGAGKESKSRGPDIHRSRTASYSPPTKPTSHRKFEDSSSFHPTKSSKVKEMNSSNAAAGTRHGGKKGIKDISKHKPATKEDSKHSGKKDKKRGNTGGKKGSDKKKRKGRSSSASSGESSDADSCSSSSSRSTSTSSSSSSNNTSSSDSSVPSIKLKTEKPIKGKKKKNKPEKGIPPPKTLSTSRSSSSEREHRSAIDLREKLNARSPSGIKEQYHPKSSGGRKDDSPMKRSKIFERPIDEERHMPKKRSVPQEPVFIPDDVKRRRLLSPSPSEKYRQTIDNPPHLPRRAPPQMHEAPKRGRSPGFQKEPTRTTHSPMRRPRVDEPPRRPDFRNEVDKRNPAMGALVRAPGFNPGMKPREFDRYREPDFRREGHPPRERVAPSRNPMDNRQEREREAPTDYQRRPRPFIPSESNRGRGGGFRTQHNNMEKDRPGPRFGGRGGGGARMGDETRHVPLIPKSKEALAERYEQMKKSGYVDKWVDETVKTVQRPVEDLDLDRMPPVIVPGNPMAVPTIPVEKVEDKGQCVESKDLSDIIVETEVLSDVSDDDDGFINNEESVLDSTILSETPVISAPETDDIQKKELKEPEEKIPVGEIKPLTVEETPSVSSQDRGSGFKPVYVPEVSGRSLPSQSQTDDDILETMDFEEISEDELGEVENKVHIVDALGIDWASLVCQEKKRESQVAIADSSFPSARKRWNPLRWLSHIGVSKDLVGDTLYNRIMSGDSDMDKSDQGDLEIKEQSSSSSRNKCVDILDKIGLGPNSRALSARRDMAVRRYFLGLPQKTILSMDLIHQSASNVPPPEMESAELYKLSISLFKPVKEVAELA